MPMTVLQYFLTCVQEEAAELTVQASKCSRFGLDAIDPSSPESGTATERLLHEYADLVGAMSLLMEQLPGGLNGDVEIRIAKAARIKRERVLKFMAVSRERGLLD